MGNEKFLLPTADSVFKRTFGNKAHKNICIDFLNNVLGRHEGSLITDVEFLDTFNHPKNPDDRLSILDINCIDQEKKSYIIEVQVEAQKNFGMRSQYYISRVLSEQLSAGGKFTDLTPVIFIGVLEFTLFPRHNRCVTHHMFSDTVDGKQDLNLMEVHFIELPKFEKNENELKTDLDKWIFFLKDAGRYLDLPQKIARGNKAISEAFEIVSRHNWTKIDLKIYEKELDITRCRQDAIETAEEKGIKKGMKKGIEQGIKQGLRQGIEQGVERGLKQGIEQGIEKGMERGIEKGIEQGIEKGIEQGRIEEKKATARAMLTKGFDTKIIAETTGLTIEQINKLKDI